jgi:hypothetical protein
MQLIKSVFLAGLFFVVAAVSVFAMYNRGFFDSVSPAFANTWENQVKPYLPSQIAQLFSNDKSPTTTNTTDSTNTTSVRFDNQDAEQQLATLTDRGQEVSNEIGKVLGEYVQVNEKEEDKALHEKAFEYGQYLYCQQVIKEYETATTASPSGQQ